MQLHFSMREVKSGLVQESFGQIPLAGIGLCQRRQPFGEFLDVDRFFGAKRQQNTLWTDLSQRLPVTYGKQEGTISLGSPLAWRRVSSCWFCSRKFSGVSHCQGPCLPWGWARGRWDRATRAPRAKICACVSCLSQLSNKTDCNLSECRVKQSLITTAVVCIMWFTLQLVSAKIETHNIITCHNSTNY